MHVFEAERSSVSADSSLLSYNYFTLPRRHQAFFWFVNCGAFTGQGLGSAISGGDLESCRDN